MIDDQGNVKPVENPMEPLFSSDEIMKKVEQSLRRLKRSFKF